MSFDETIRLSDSKEEALRSARDAIESKVKKHFKEKLEENIPDFRQQGSFDLRTIVTPLSGEFDIDYGVFLNNLSDDKEEWESPQETQNWIYEAVIDHTDHTAIKKQKCVRVKYKGEYHVDLPVYGTYDDTTFLADTDNDWIESNPKAFKDWLLERLEDYDEGLRRCIRYIKAWADYQSEHRDLPAGFVLTILIAENFSNDDRDDRAFASTISNIKQYLEDNDEILNPVDENEDLRQRMGEETYKNLLDKIDELNNSGTNALRENDSKKSCEVWADEFGDRFPSCSNLDESKEDEYVKTSAPAILNDDHRSA